ncbi:hypothetical protein [Methanosarcina sp. WH1]|nr:hypothetical protein [Methanosarcina sp. WH1]AKB19588.1 hypothetical protein MSWHS_2725 [Methanosarcina sp. WWM596]AKB22624.1 hypothetical protein MSWH1_2353 [Methanosarcina sp. WH1]
MREEKNVNNLIELLEEKPVTNHELHLVIDYVLEIIDNRSWMEDKQAYVNYP